jgi:N,N'-diacetyllegionaminate synthase
MVDKFLIAEAGINHNGDLKTALKLVDAAKKSGADSVKFQTYKTEKRIKKKYTEIFDILKKCELSYKEFRIIKHYCDERKITFFSTPFDTEAVDFLSELNVKYFKIASFDISNNQLIEKILSKKTKTIVSTGMASLNEITKTYKKFDTKKVPLILLHCISAYPNKKENSYLANIKFLQKKFNCEIGLSDHNNGTDIPIIARAMGVKYIEKHFKLSDKHKCVDAQVSISAKKFLKLKNEIEYMDKIIGKVKFGIRKEEVNSKIFKRNKTD